MVNTDPVTAETLQKQLAQLLETNRADLVGQYQQILRETQFLNRAEVRPNMLKGIAADEAQAFLDFLGQPAYSSLDYGSHLYQIGLSDQVLLRLNQTTRQFMLPHMLNGQTAQMLALVDHYQSGVIRGYIQALEKHIFTEQELTRQAFLRAIGQI
jgi:hypothetical protein